MDWRKQAYVRHQQQRWLRPDATRWVRPDAAKFLKHGTRVAEIFPALERKYPGQPRVPAGNGIESGRWGDGGSSSGRPRVHIFRTDPQSDEVGDGSTDIGLPSLSFDLGDIASEIDKLDLFDIKPSKPRSGGVRIAGDPPQRLPAIIVTPEEPSEIGIPGVGHNEAPPLDPPEIPEQRPSTTKGRMAFVRQAAKWMGYVRGGAFAVDAFLGALEQIEELKSLTDMIKTANDPPRTLDELQDRAQLLSEAGYHNHHLAEESAARDAGFSESLIQGRSNIARTPILKHIDITAEYTRKVEQPDGTMKSPRELLSDKDFETRRQYGLGVLRRHGVLK